MKKNDKQSEAELRRQAEVRLNKQKQTAQSERKISTQRLSHELDVHQIELEMQNEELVQARSELEAALNQYTDLYDFAPVGYFTLTRDGTIRHANLAGSNLLGLKHNELIQRRLGVFVSSESREPFNIFFEQLLSGEGKSDCELAFDKKEGGRLWARLEATCFEGNDVCRVMAMDITERKHAQEHLTFQSNILANITDVVYATDEHLQLTFWNRAAERLYGWKEEDVLGKNVVEVVNSQFDPEKRARLSQELIESGSVTGEIEHRTRSGRVVFFISTTILVHDSTGKAAGFVSVNHDITERKQVEEELRDANEELTRFNKAMVGRELRMIELKKEVNSLCAQTSQPMRYPLDFEEEQ